MGTDQNGPQLPDFGHFWPENPFFAIGPRILSMARLKPFTRRSIWHLWNDFLNFSFLSYGPKWPKMAIFGSGRISYISTPNFGPISMKLGPIVRFAKKVTLYECGPVSSP